MKSAGGDYWRNLLVLLRATSLIAGRHLRHPCPVSLPPATVMAELHHRADHQGLAPLLNRHLLSTLALPPSLRPQPGQLPLHVISSIPGYTEEMLLQTHWLCVPILTCQGQSASTTWILLGRVPPPRDFSFIGEPQPEASSKATANAALAAIQTHGTCSGHGFLAIMLQHPDDPPLTGGSLGLPLALGMLLADQGKHWPERVYASGGLSADGRILSVRGEDLKYGQVAHALKMLVYPDSGLIDTMMDAKVVRCADLAQALFALDCMQEGADGADVVHYRACLVHPSLFLSQFRLLPLGLLNFAMGREQLARLKKERHQLLPALAHCLAACADDPERTAHIADLFDVQEIAAIGRQETDEAIAAYRWCVARIACANRSGAVADGQAWIALAQDLAQRMGGGKRSDCANHGFITARFNRYDFRPEPPDDFARHLNLEQQIYQIDQRDNRALGALYGTLAQNYGFCGLAYQQQFDECIRLAEAAFGREHRRESLRLLAYQIYNRIDGRHYQEAFELLNRYLGVPADNGPRQWIEAVRCQQQHTTEHSPFQAAIVCRLLVELVHAGQIEAQPDWCRPLARMIPSRLSHPWQLTTCNLGQLFLAAGLPDQGTTLLHRCTEACLGGGITMVPMALLPLAALHGFSPGNAGVLESCSEVLLRIRASSVLHLPHFQPLTDAPSPAKALGAVLANPGRYFPFSYR